MKLKEMARPVRSNLIASASRPVRVAPLIRPARPGTVERPVLRLAGAKDRERIYQMRHEVYARELGQHAINETGQLKDTLDDFNQYVVAEMGGVIVGFISITPPASDGSSYSIDKYVERGQLPFVFDDALFEARLLTV